MKTYKRNKPSMSNVRSAIRQIRTIQELREHNKNKSSTMAPVKVVLTPVVDQYQTQSSHIQHETETMIVSLFEAATSDDHILKKERHKKYLRSLLGGLPGAFRTLDASKPWLIYWNLNALSLLGDDISDISDAAADTLLSCQSPTGGFGGGHCQLAHLAPTYAAVNALALCGNKSAWDRIDREAMYRWLMEMKQPDGSFTMHRGGETDTRASYCALSIAALLNLLTDDLVENTGRFIQSCQTYEGGFSAIPGTEAHGGYAFCALAALSIIGPPSVTLNKYLNMPQLIKWLSSQQSQPEKGFSGRTNKLVDGCYNHWVGGCWALIESATDYVGLWDRQGLQDYTMVCCQSERGGLIDKPGKNPDAYHTNYTLSGLSGAQHIYTYAPDGASGLGDYSFKWSSAEYPSLELPDESRIPPINPVHVLPEGVADAMHGYFVVKDES